MAIARAAFRDNPDFTSGFARYEASANKDFAAKKSQD
jgi:hypothetical protein